jgi:hypothetical protein
MADATIEMPQDEVDAIIRNKRKARDPKGLLLRHALLQLELLIRLIYSLLRMPQAQGEPRSTF